MNVQDHCRTAADVWAQAAKVRAWRQQLKPPIRRVFIRVHDRPVALKVKRYSPIREAGMKPVTFIQQTVANHYDISIHEMLCHMRDPRWMVPRMVAMYLARTVAEMSLPDIGRHFKRDHATVLNAVRRIEMRCAEDAEFKQIVETLSEGCRK